MNAVRRLLESVWPLLVPSAGLVLTVGVLSLFGGLQGSLVSALINLTLVVGLWTFTGNSGVLSFGHASFMAIGAYVGALLTIPEMTKSFLLPDLPGLIRTTTLSTEAALVVAALAAAVVAVVAGAPLMRLSGLAASIATLSGLVIVNVVVSNWTALTGGTGTLAQIPITTGVWTALFAALLAMAVGFAFQRSASGLRLRASREDLVAARAIGVREARDRLVAFALSAMTVAVGGGLYGHYLGSISPDAFYLNVTFLAIAMLVVGGLHSLSGAVVGTAVISTITEVLRHVESAGTIPAGVQGIVLSALVIASLALRPDGITGGREASFPKRWRISRRPELDARARPAKRTGVGQNSLL